MQLAFLSDIHGNHIALKSVLNNLPGTVDHILFAGDLSGYYPYVTECCDLLKSYRVTGVRGNHDQVLLQAWMNRSEPEEAYSKKYGSALLRTWRQRDKAVCETLMSFPEVQNVVFDGRKISLMHGSPADHLEGRIYPDFNKWDEVNLPPEADVVCLGHTHYAFHRRFGSCLVFNPGSVGQARDGAGASYALLDTRSLEISFRFVQYDVQIIVADAQKHNPDLPYLWNVLTR